MFSYKREEENLLSNTKQFIDLEKTKWYYEAKLEAIDSHRQDINAGITKRRLQCTPRALKFDESGGLINNIK